MSRLEGFRSFVARKLREERPFQQCSGKSHRFESVWAKAQKEWDRRLEAECHARLEGKLAAESSAQLKQIERELGLC